jgi:hypothetical protein
MQGVLPDELREPLSTQDSNVLTVEMLEQQASAVRTTKHRVASDQLFWLATRENVGEAGRHADYYSPILQSADVACNSALQ